MRLAQIRSVESFAQQTAERRGPKGCRKMKTPAGSTLFSIRIIRTSSLHHFGRRDASHGFSPAAAQAADFIGRKTTASHGSAWRETDFLAESWARLASRFPEPIPTASMQSSRRKKVVS